MYGENRRPFKNIQGEETCPKSFEGTEKALIWLYERKWNEEVKGDSELLKTYLDEYATVRLLDFESGDGTPTTLKALLFNRFCKGCWSMAGAVPDFKKWYVSTYQKMGV